MSLTARPGRSAVVTNAGAGLGREVALVLAGKGYIIFGTADSAAEVSDLKHASRGRVSLAVCDTTKALFVEAWAGGVTGALGSAGLNLLINNARMLVQGPLEILPLDAIRHEFDYNVFGAISVTNAFLPALRKARGRIVQISAWMANLPLPFSGPSEASLAAIEVFSAVYRAELRPFGVEVVIACTGDFTTSVLLDHIGPLDLAPGVDRSVDVRPHPHIGLSTVSYLFAGEIMHRDSLGYEQAIRPQEVNWMTAGSGITHSERFERARAHGDHLHGIQAWVALPNGREETAPSFSHHSASDLPQWTDKGVIGHLIAGSAYGLTAAAETYSPLFYAHLDMAPGATAEIPGGHQERAIYIATGAIELSGSRYEAGRMLVLGATASSVRAFKRSSVMVLGGEPVGERSIYWNFVSSSKDRLAQAASDWKAGLMKLPDADDAEFIPLPEESPPLASAMS